MPADMPPARAPAPLAARVLRSLVAVVGGYLIFVLSAVALFQLSGRNPHATQPLWFVTASAVYGMAFAALGGFAAARMAPTRALLHACSVAAIMALGAVASLVASPSTDASWSQWTALALMAPSACLGGRVATRARRAD